MIVFEYNVMFNLNMYLHVFHNTSVVNTVYFQTFNQFYEARKLFRSAREDGNKQILNSLGLY